MFAFAFLNSFFELHVEANLHPIGEAVARGLAIPVVGFLEMHDVGLANVIHA
jgi:hypothetical protein